MKWSTEVNEDFHARFSALSRRYRYIIYNRPQRFAILPTGITHHHYPLDEKLMHIAGQYLLGENDFSSFRAAQCQSKSPYRNVHHLQVSRIGDYLIVDIQANAFVHHMVRNIVGSLLVVGEGKQKPEWIKWLLQQRDRSCAAPTAKAAGLYLVEVHYPNIFQLPKSAVGPLFLPDEII